MRRAFFGRAGGPPFRTALLVLCLVWVMDTWRRGDDTTGVVNLEVNWSWVSRCCPQFPVPGRALENMHEASLPGKRDGPPDNAGNPTVNFRGRVARPW